MAHNSFDSRSHSTLLSASLKNLDQQDGAKDGNGNLMNEFPPNLKENILDSHKRAAESSNPPFRSPPYTATSSTGTQSPIPDPNGLGWPGEYVCVRACARYSGKTVFLALAPFSFIGFSAKSTLLRLNATPAEKLEREQRLAGAVRTILECLGEDPDREGLQKTPERYAKALMWMTRGYEERLKGNHTIH